jgi:hypothetical protein
MSTPGKRIDIIPLEPKIINPRRARATRQIRPWLTNVIDDMGGPLPLVPISLCLMAAAGCAGMAIICLDPAALSRLASVMWVSLLCGWISFCISLPWRQAL